ncbi:DUF4166 domain-containing protein [Comamonas odontotermitis]|uniref:DUF4166 domain-containing protein n=1 Tax=Comamonas odontotermitis TaxID=379895 RepID=UPI001CC3515A|nr:DUF4166 domain-containing protein [Comamonas odontotermitis]UBB18430.1 DUF4166 domain-containing protein [Comamonas odontotermitis]
MSTLHSPHPNIHPAHADALDISALVGPAAWQQLSPAIHRRFASQHAPVAYAGHMELRTSRIGRLFAWAAQLLGSPLAGSRAGLVPTQVQVASDGRGGVVWSRQLGECGSAGSQAVRSTKRLGPGGQLEECTEGGLSMALEVCVEQGALVFYSRRYFWLLGRWRLPVPALLTPGVCRVEHRDEGPGCFRFTLEMTHPLWGRTFYQTGVFSDPLES